MMKKLFPYVIALVLIPLLSQGFPAKVLAQSDTTEVDTIQLVSTFESISVYSSFSGDDNENNQVTQEYRVAGSSTWLAAPIPMVVDRRPEVPIPNTGWGDRPVPEYMANPYNNQWRGNILFLTPNTVYEVRVTYSDPDGVVGSTSHTASVKTWDEDPPSTGGELHVSPGGSDSNPGTLAAPLATPSRAANLANPGDTVYIHGGTYTSSYSISSVGQEDNYIRWMPYGDGDVTLSAFRAFSVGGDYNRIIGENGGSRFLFTQSSSDGGSITGDYNRFENCIFSSGMTIGPGEGSSTIRGRGNVISDCQFDRRLQLLNCAGNLVIRRNTIRAHTTGGSGDGIYGSPNFPGYSSGHAIDWGGERKDSDIYQNEIWDVGDDILELEGAGINSRVWSNRLHYCRKGRGGVALGLAPAAVIGPKYVFRNIVYDFDGSALKLGKLSTGQVFVYHNVFYGRTYRWEGDGSFDASGYGFQNSGGEAYFNHHFRNNIVGVYQCHIEATDLYEFPALISRMRLTEPLNDWDYNCYFGTTGHWWMRYWVYGESGPREFRSLDAWKEATGQEAHGFNADPMFIDSYPTVGNFRLEGGSPCINAGVVLPGFNDATSPWPYTGSSPDIGAYEYGSPQGQNPPFLYPIGDKVIYEEELLEFAISAYDPDGDTLTFSASNLPPGASFDDQTRTFSWTPASGQAGTYDDVHFEVSDGELTDSEDITITVNQPASLPLRINAAGELYVDSSGNSWLADQDYVSGSWGFYGEDHAADRGVDHPISGTEDDRIYQTLRFNFDGYRFDLGDGSYTVVLHFAETYWTGPGQRVFDTSIEGQLVLDDLDIFSQVGRDTALSIAFNNIEVQDGQLNIECASSVDYPMINGIEIFAAGSNNPPVLNPIGNKVINEGELLEFTISASDPDGDPLTFSASNLPAGADFGTDTRTFSWTPASGQAGTYPDVHFQVSDGSLTDSEDITITVNTAGTPVGGGGGGGGSDTSPPRFSDITVSEVSETSATVSWATHELGDSQVEYWASPHLFSSLDETLVRSHVVQLTGLNPATTYSYRVMSHDAAGNLAVSDEYTLTTLGTPATFVVSSMEINPTEVNTGETVIVRVTVTNNGDATGDYEVVLKINDTVVATKDVTGLPGGATQEVVFNAARDAAGFCTVEVNGVTGSFTVTAAPAAEAILFNVAPAYNSETGQFARARIIYEVESPAEPMTDVRLALKVGLDGEPIEELSLFTADQLDMGRSGSLDYIPAQGWENGTYTFQAELYANGELYASTATADLEVSADTAVAVVRWATLGAIISIMLVVIAVTVVMILRRRRDMLGA